MPVEIIFAALKDFLETVAAKTMALTAGEPEDQLRAPFEDFMREFGRTRGLSVLCTGEVRLADRLGKPDYAVHVGSLLAGYVELKAPGIGADTSRFVARNREQSKRFAAIPNLLYCDGNEWGLYRNGLRVRPLVRLPGDIATERRSAVGAEDARSLEGLLSDFLSWQPIIPITRKGEIGLRELASLLAPLCRLLRDDVSEALADQRSPLVQLARDWRQLLFPDASDAKFADAYAQTVTFALLLARGEGASPLSLGSAQDALAASHTLLSRALQVLTDSHAQQEISASVKLLMRVIGEIPVEALIGPKNPWLYFYEDFLAVYDPKLRRDAGAYYTPIEVVRAQVRLIDDLLTNRMGKALGFADRTVVTLDPAAGTGTYLLGVIEHALERIRSQYGAGAVPGQATDLAQNIYGFENMVGPYAVAELRVSRALQDNGARLPAGGANVYLTDTLESPSKPPPALPLFLKPIADQHAKALRVKANVPVIVCLGNPPYDRHEAADETNKASTGGWVRWGEEGTGAGAIFKDFLEPARGAGHGVRAHNLYNLYVYFWRWALWKVFEKTAGGPGVVSYISASSYLDGDAFCGMREYMRRLCDEIWILDLGGEGRGTRRNDNVFAIQTPVAIALAVRFGNAQPKKPATVRIATIIDGTRDDKLQSLAGVSTFDSLNWQECPADWQAPFRPSGNGTYFDWPLLTDLFPWRQNGVKAGRTWVIAPDAQTLQRRWRALMNATEGERAAMFKNSPTGRNYNDRPNQLPPRGGHLKSVAELGSRAVGPEIVRYAYHSFDRQYIFADARLLDRPGPAIWLAHSDRQVYLTTLLNHPLGSGPAVTIAAEIPDLHHFRGSYGAKEIIPLYRDKEGLEDNTTPGLLEVLSRRYRVKVAPEDLLAYVYGVLAQPAFTERFSAELGTRELRVPLTKVKALFLQLRDIGAKLLWRHSYGARFAPTTRQGIHASRGNARCIQPVSGDAAGYPDRYDHNEARGILYVGDGQFSPVPLEVFAFEVSGMKVVQSWLRYRMKQRGRRQSSPLDAIRPEKWTGDFTTELLELLWLVEATLAEYPRQARLLANVLQRACFGAGELPSVPDAARRPPRHGGRSGLFDTIEADDTE